MARRDGNAVVRAALISGVFVLLGAVIGGIIPLLTDRALSITSRNVWEWALLSVGLLCISVVIPGVLVRTIWAVPFRRSQQVPIDQQLAIDEARASAMRFELKLIACLAVLAVLAFAASYVASRSVFASVQEQRFGPAETAQVITAVGGLGLAIGTSIAAIIKAYALLIRARADFIRAKLNLPPGADAEATAPRQISSSEQ